MLDKYRFGVGFFATNLSVFELSGKDVESFIQNQSTYDFKSLPINHFHLVSFLSPQGRVEFYSVCLKSAQEVKLLVPSVLAEIAMECLDRFLISEDVEIKNLGPQEWFVIIGPHSHREKSQNSFQGIIFEEQAYISQTRPLQKVVELSLEEVILWQSLNGWPSFEGSDFQSELINNLRLYDLSVSPNKGCYPGQETVSKIATRRGAAYAPVLLETTHLLAAGDIYSFEKKIGNIQSSHLYNGRFFSCVNLLRDFRVAGMKIHFKKDDLEYDATVRYYPLLSGSNQVKARDLFYDATEAFRVGQLEEAEKLFKKAIDFDPSYGDAYEALGVMLGRLERYVEGIELMEKLCLIDPASVLAHTNKSLFLMKLGKIEEAESEKSLATIKSFQKFGDEAKLNEKILAEKKAQMEEWEKREGMFRQVLEIDNEDTLANYGIGSISVEKKEWDSAIHHLEKVLEHDSQYSVAYLALGKAYKGLGLRQKAQDIWKEGIKVAAKKGDLMPANQMQFELENL